MNIEYKFFYFGPLLVKFKVRPDHIQALKKIISKKAPKMTKDLAGVIEHEYEVAPEAYEGVMKDYINGYGDAYENWSGGKTLNGYFKSTRVWVNYMQAGEYNPPHLHTGCHLSSVLFLSMPEKLKKENKKWRDKGIKSHGPGCISFNTLSSGNFCNGGYEQFPEEGDFFMFPAQLLHYVAPFKSKCERISIAANFNLVSEN